MNPKNWNIKKILKETAIALLMIFVVSNVMSYLRKPTLDSDLLPSFEVQTILNKNINTKTYEEKPLLVHVWATWCPTCKLEAANIQSVSEKYNVITIAVKSGDDKALQAYMDENKFTFDVINDSDGRLSKRFHVEVFPTTFIYGSDSKLKFTEVGYSTTAGLLARLAMIE